MPENSYKRTNNLQLNTIYKQEGCWVHFLVKVGGLFVGFHRCFHRSVHRCVHRLQSSTTLCWICSHRWWERDLQSLNKIWKDNKPVQLFVCLFFYLPGICLPPLVCSQKFWRNIIVDFSSVFNIYSILVLVPVPTPEGTIWLYNY